MKPIERTANWSTIYFRTQKLLGADLWVTAIGTMWQAVWNSAGPATWDAVRTGAEEVL